VAGTLGLATALPAAANHDYMVLVPYVVKDGNRTTVVTLIGEGIPVSAGQSLHLQYWTKSTTDANTAACQPSSVTVPFTDNDIMTFDTAGLLGYPLFGDSTNPAPLGVSISYAAPRHGYLLVEWVSGDGGQGYWLELDLANGGAHGDWSLGEDDGDFRGFTDGTVLKANDNSSGGWGNSHNRAVPFWPSSVASTAFTVTPLGSDMLNKENNQVVMQVRNDDGVQGAYDRNENGVDGTVPITVRCVGRVTPAQLMPGVVTNAAWAAQGGWGFLRNMGDNDDSGFILGSNASSSYGFQNDAGDLDALVYQVDTSTAGGKFMSNATRIISEQNDQYRDYIPSPF
jgi:hypothetical protein